MTDYLGDACLRRDGRDHVLESEIFFFGHPSVIAHPARPAESRKAQHHPTAAAVGTVIPPALQHPQSSALADCGGCCRRHCPLAIRRLGARWHDMNCLVLWHWRMKRRERNCTERVTGTEARSQLTATGFPQCRLNLQLGLAPLLQATLFHPPPPPTLILLPALCLYGRFLLPTTTWTRHCWAAVFVIELCLLCDYTANGIPRIWEIR